MVTPARMARQDATRRPVRCGEVLWTPDAARIERANLTRYEAWLEREHGFTFDGYLDLWRWSTRDLEGFWWSIWEYFAVEASERPTAVLGRREMPGAEWFPGARLNYAQHVLRRAGDGGVALLHKLEGQPAASLGWDVLGAQVRSLATELRRFGVRPGDRVVGYLPNVPQAVVAMLATTAIGAIWASCASECGWRGAAERFGQLDPRVLFAADGFRYGGQTWTRGEQVETLVRELGTVELLVHVPVISDSAGPSTVGSGTTVLDYGELVGRAPVRAEDFVFEPVAFDHPLWVLFSSGSSGLPKAIVQGHGGILLEQLKLQTFHMDLGVGDRLFFYTTTSWMMWNFVASSLLIGATPILYDGSPTYPRLDGPWQLVEELGVTFFGTNPSYIAAMMRLGMRPRDRFDVSTIRTVMPAGAPVSAEAMAWLYESVDEDLWLATGSGGTDCCTGFVGGVPTLPVRGGEIQAPSLGVAVAAFDPDGNPVIDEVGELVVTEPMPSMPLFLWGDDGDVRYRETYFTDYPGVWRHGDRFLISEHGGCRVLGRSDATLNRHGVRIGTAEIYRVLQSMPEIDDALIVNVERPGGGSFMPLFVHLVDGVLDPKLENRIRKALRDAYTRRHVPDQIVQVPGIPMTSTGKRMEIPVRKVLSGVPAAEAFELAAMADPTVVDAFVAYASRLTRRWST